MWVSDFNEIILKQVNPIAQYPEYIKKGYVWAEAVIEKPPVPKKERHLCEWPEESFHICKESDEGILEFWTYNQMGRRICLPVEKCPFCGFTKEKK